MSNVTTQKQKNEKILRKCEVRKIVGLSDATLWRMEKARKFPTRLRLGAGAVGWLESEIQEWIAARAADRGAEQVRAAAQGQEE